MAMSQGERMLRLQEQSRRFLSRQQTKDSSQQTLIVQAKASKYVFPQNRTPARYSIEGTVVSMGSQVPNTRDKAIGKNVYSADGAPIACCATVVASGSATFDQQNALAQQAQGCTLCAQPDYSLFNGYAIDLSGEFVKGGVLCPYPNLVNTAKTTDAEKCSSCLQFYFPKPAQPSLCNNCGTPYPASALYPPEPIDWQLRRYGDIRVPQQARQERRQQNGNGPR